MAKTIKSNCMDTEKNNPPITSSEIADMYIEKYKWEPKHDITTYELALCVPAIEWAFESYIEKLPANCQRHFSKVKR